MGSGGVRSSCQSTLCILAGIVLGLALLALLCGVVLYGVSSTFTMISNAHIANHTASNFTRKMDHKLDNMRSSSAKKAAGMMEKAYKFFVSAGGLGVAAVLFLVLSCVRPELAPPITSDPFAPAPDPFAPAPYPFAPAPYPFAPAPDSSAPPGKDAKRDTTSPEHYGTYRF